MISSQSRHRTRYLADRLRFVDASVPFPRVRLTLAGRIVSEEAHRQWVVGTRPLSQGAGRERQENETGDEDAEGETSRS